MDKAVSGEAVAVEIQNPYLRHAVKLDYRVIEADCVTSPVEHYTVNRAIAPSEADGIRLDAYGFPTAYHILDYHPGGTGALPTDKALTGKWIPARQVLHVFRPMRGWHRGIPELTPSIPLCAVARRYTMALVRCAEIQASLAAVLESDIPAYRNLATPPTKVVEKRDEQGNVIGTETVTDTDDGPMFDTMPIELGSFNLLPQGFRFKEFGRVPVGQQYDLFMGALLREIIRPLLVPYNIAVGSSKDSNMASGVLDAGLYTQGQKAERCVFEEDVLEPIVQSWYETGCLTDGYFTESGTMPQNLRELPDHEFGWDRVTVEHTDPTKVAGAIAKHREILSYTDRYIQEELLGQDYEDWQDAMREQAVFQKELNELRGGPDPNQNPNVSNRNDSNETEDEET